MQYKSKIFEAIHEDAVAMFEVGAISAARMREYDEACLVREPETARETGKSPERGQYSPAAAGI